MTNSTIIGSGRQVKQVNWSEGTAESDSVTLGLGRSFSLCLPADFQGSSVTVKARIQGDGPRGHKVDIWKDFYKDGAPLVVPIAVDKINYLPAELFSGLDEIRFVSDIAEDTNPIGWLQAAS